jgi:hypothetical protein
MPTMALPRFIEIDGRRYLWRDLGASPRPGNAGRAAARVVRLARGSPAGQRAGRGERYREPSLFTMLERRR